VARVAVKYFPTLNRLAASLNAHLARYHVSLEDAHTVLAQARLIVFLELAYHVDWMISHVNLKDSPLVDIRCSTLVDHAQFCSCFCFFLKG
jgi:hypothetical protein